MKMTSNKQYGLLLSGKNSRPKVVVNKNSVFGNEDDIDDDTSKAPSGRPVSKYNVQTDTNKAFVKRQVQADLEKALAEDPNVFEYDAVYEQVQANKIENIKIQKSTDERKPKYIAGLMKAAELRKKEDERRIEKKVQKEREAEKGQFDDKEAFVTGAYRQKLAEMKEEEEKERRRQELEDKMDVTKQQDLSQFYRNILQQTTGEIELKSVKQEQENLELAVASATQINPNDHYPEDRDDSSTSGSDSSSDSSSSSSSSQTDRRKKMKERRNGSSPSSEVDRSRSDVEKSYKIECGKKSSEREDSRNIGKTSSARSRESDRRERDQEIKDRQHHAETTRLDRDENWQTDTRKEKLERDRQLSDRHVIRAEKEGDDRSSDRRSQKSMGNLRSDNNNERREKESSRSGMKEDSRSSKDEVHDSKARHHNERTTDRATDSWHKDSHSKDDKKSKPRDDRMTDKPCHGRYNDRDSRVDKKSSSRDERPASKASHSEYRRSDSRDDKMSRSRDERTATVNHSSKDDSKSKHHNEKTTEKASHCGYIDSDLSRKKSNAASSYASDAVAKDNVQTNSSSNIKRVLVDDAGSSVGTTSNASLIAQDIVTKFPKKTVGDALEAARARYLARKQTIAPPIVTNDDDD